MAVESINKLAGNVAPPIVRDPAAAVTGKDSGSLKAVETQTAKATSQVAKTEAEQAKPAASKDDLDAALKKINSFVANNSSDIQFTLDQDTGTRIVKVVDRETKDVIRQFPSEEAIQISKALDKLQGLLIRQKA